MGERLLETTMGLMEESALERIDEDEDVPCGRAKTSTWYFRGRVVKRDVVIIANNVPSIGGVTGGFV